MWADALKGLEDFFHMMPAVLHPSQQQFKCSGVYFVAIPFHGNNLVYTLAPQQAAQGHVRAAGDISQY